MRGVSWKSVLGSGWGGPWGVVFFLVQGQLAGRSVDMLGTMRAHSEGGLVIMAISAFHPPPHAVGPWARVSHTG